MSFEVGITYFCKNLHGIVFGNMHFCDLLIQIREYEENRKDMHV